MTRFRGACDPYKISDDEVVSKLRGDLSYVVTYKSLIRSAMMKLYQSYVVELGTGVNALCAR